MAKLKTEAEKSAKNVKTNKRHGKADASSIAMGAAGAATAAGTIGVTAAVANVQTQPFDRSLWNPALLQEGAQRNIPINDLPILMAHNSGSQPGSGTLFFSQNQTMTPYDLLENTPTRGLEFQVENINGQFVTNHGAELSTALTDPTVSNPETLTDQLASVQQFLDQPENSDQVVVIKLTNNDTDPNSSDQINALLTQQFGNALFTTSDFQQAVNQGSWPTVNQLTANGKHVVVLSTWVSGGDSIPASYTLNSALDPNPDAVPPNMVWNYYGEDRTMLGSLGSGVTANLPPSEQFVGGLDTAQTDQLIQQGGLISLDQLQPNDPRLVAPDKRDQLALDPDVSLFHGMIEVNRGVASSALFGLGVFSDTGAGAFAVAEIAVAAYQQAEFIKHASINLKAAIAAADLVDISEFKKHRKQASAQAVIPAEIAAYCRKQLIAQLTTATLKAGATGTTSLALPIFFLGELFPFIFPITAILSLVILAVGAVSTGIATYFSRRALHKKLDKLLATSTMVAVLQDKTDAMNSPGKAAPTQHEALAKEKQVDSTLSTVSTSLFGSMLLLRIGAMAKYAVAAVGVVAAGFMLGALYFKSAFDAVINYRNRQKHLLNIPRLIAQATSPSIDRRRFIFFGETALEKFMRDPDHKIFETYKLPAAWRGLTPRALIKRLLNADHPEDSVKLTAIRKACTMDHIEKDLRKFCKTSKLDYQPGDELLLKKYLLKRVNNHISSDVRASGRINSFKLAAAFAGAGSFLAPPLVAFFVAAGVAIMLIGEIVTRLVSRRETKRFKVAAEDLLDKALTGNAAGNPAVAALAGFVGSLKAELTQKQSAERGPRLRRLPVRATSTKRVLSALISADSEVASKAADHVDPELPHAQPLSDNTIPFFETRPRHGSDIPTFNAKATRK